MSERAANKFIKRMFGTSLKLSTAGLMVIHTRRGASLRFAPYKNGQPVLWRQRELRRLKNRGGIFYSLVGDR